MASARLGALQQEEQGLVKERAALGQRADVLAKESTLVQTRHAVSVLADNVSDISGRLDSLANTWAVAHAKFVEPGKLLQNIDKSTSRSAFMWRIGLIAKQTVTLTTDIREYMYAVAPGGVLVKPVTKVRAPSYDVSRMYGWSDRGGGAVEFDDTRVDLHATMPIAEIYVNSGWVVDGVHPVHRLKDGTTFKKTHGTTLPGGHIVLGRKFEIIQESLLDLAFHSSD
ncbi:hypothetical protein RhiJN_08686 [Ceratobasidium sp. AG-Ba]|nr:hypothetical protein RhiJN_08686 [Ceratobasidium sp. AG-Ba]QRW09465.1 hypothetical protein RhiLY_08464 [Ceratobasidium sp. AG-Ba]